MGADHGSHMWETLKRNGITIAAGWRKPGNDLKNLYLIVELINDTIYVYTLR